MVSRLVVDVDAFTVLSELLDDVWLPAGFVAGWDPGADPERVTAARVGARARLRAAGLLVPTDPTSPAGPTIPTGSAGSSGPNDPPDPLDSPGPNSADRLSDNGFHEIVHPSLRLALEGFGRAGIRVDLRSWAGDRVVAGNLAIGRDAGVGLTRLRGAPGGSGGPGVSVGATPGVAAGADALGVELAVFEPGESLAALERLLPPLPEVSSGGGAMGSVRVGLAEGLAVLSLLRRRDSMGSQQLPVAREVLRILLGSAGLAAVPPLLELLAGPLEAAIRITLSTPGRAGADADGGGGAGGGQVWFGYWLQCGGQLIAVRAEPGSGPGVPVPVQRDDKQWDDEQATEPWDDEQDADQQDGLVRGAEMRDGQVDDPGAGGDIVLSLVPTDGRGLQTDLLSALTGAFVVSGSASVGEGES